MFLISDAVAQTTSTAATDAASAAYTDTANPFMSLLPLLIIITIFYFLIIRPQQKRLKEHQQMVSNIRRGDKVVTAGGLIGTIVKVENDDEVQIELAENVRVRAVKSTLSSVVGKPQPAGEKGEGEKKSKIANDN